jgi:hypothetical protein
MRGIYAGAVVVAVLIVSSMIPPQPATPPPAAGEVLEEFCTDTGFTTAITGDATLVAYEVRDGAMLVHHKPRELHNAISVSKTYR